MNDDFVISRIERKAKLRKVFDDTLSLLDNNSRLISETNAAKANAEFYSSSDRPIFNSEKIKTIISVTNERTFEAAKRLSKEKEGKIAVLNFANSVTPGGGVYGGSGAQEESLCRCSNLYPVIEQNRFREAYYEPNRRNNNDVCATDDIIYAHDITVFKSDTDFPELLPENEWYKVDVITCAAPNLIGVKTMRYGGGDVSPNLDDKWQLKIHHSRTRQILRSALANNARRIVLGAFGCGAFRNNPKSVASSFRMAINDFEGQFEEIVFAIYHQPYELQNYNAFKLLFEGEENTEYNFERFLNAQSKEYERALAEITAGKKESHWMWYIFPQLTGLGFSRQSRFYGISGVEEAKAYLKNNTLRNNLLEITNKLYECDGDISDIMGYPDDLKLLSCMTLFNAADPSEDIFQKVIDKFYSGKKDQKTLDMIRDESVI